MAGESLKSKVTGALGRAVEKVLADETRAAKVAQAVGKVQKGREALEQAQENVMRALGLASRSDYKEIAKRLSALKRRVRHLAEEAEKRGE